MEAGHGSSATMVASSLSSPRGLTVLFVCEEKIIHGNFIVFASWSVDTGNKAFASVGCSLPQMLFSKVV